MRILLASSYDLTHLGGVNSHVFDVAEQFGYMGHDVTIAGPIGKGALKHEGLVKLGGSFSFPSPGDTARVNLNPWIFKSVKKLLAEDTFDVLHLHEPFLGYIGASFLRYGEGLKVGTFHTWRKGVHLPYKVFGPVVRRWNRFLDGRIAVSASAAETANRYVPASYRVIPNGIYFEDFAYPEPPPEHLDDKRPTLLFVGRLEPRKGVSVLLNAFRLLKLRRPDARLVIVGEGTMKRSWQRTVENQGIEDVIFEGYVPRHSLRAYYHRADVFCSPSVENESFGITILEAMAAAKPVVATSNNGSETLGRDGVNGLIVPPRDPFAMAEAIERLLEDRELCERLGAGARQRAQQFDWSLVAQSILDYYGELGAVSEAPVDLPARV